MVRRQKWSPFLVPALWSAAAQHDKCPVIEWLASAAETLPSPVRLGDDTMPAKDAVLTGWACLKASLPILGIDSTGGLTEWLATHGFRRPQELHHFSAQAQELLVSAAAQHFGPCPNERPKQPPTLQMSCFFLLHSPSRGR